MNHWGRVFFIYDSSLNLLQVKAQPLENHVGNCGIILDKFRKSYFHDHTKQRLMQAVSLHDEGKKQTFKIQFSDNNKQKDKTGKKDKPQKLSYSFSGHRFIVPGKDIYIDGLIRSHHEFSVEQINREKAKLPEQDKKTFADDLYLLCMSDHLEAELAVKTVENKTENPRNFMEFVTVPLENKVFSVIPWPFEPDSFPVTFELKELDLAGLNLNNPKNIEKALKLNTDFKTETIKIFLRRD
ncbi:Uncharacterized protein dnl_34280 [Desulfonema limicola]|uniref:Uncharacterized protein n=1 Tax=Desulfonema limicola TaxID=45656 RepID=A0A975GHA3_9BACT|nr:hypothetical protein [Desulfonema limicola]QTA81102.1 Uncharacterized protein dnl_34280 [Desulfonema limicola]